MNGLEAIAKAKEAGIRYKIPSGIWYTVENGHIWNIEILLQEGWEVEKPLDEFWVCIGGVESPCHCIFDKPLKKGEHAWGGYRCASASSRLSRVKEVRE